MKTTIFVIFLLTAFISFADDAKNGYQKEIDALHYHYNAYLRQGEKNVQAMSKVTLAYQKLTTLMKSVGEARKYVQGRCNPENKENMLECLAAHSVGISLLSLYTKDGEETVLSSIEDVKQAGQILNQDISYHVQRFNKFKDGFRKWQLEVIPALKDQFEKDRIMLGKKWGQDFVKTQRENDLLNENKNQAAFLALELVHAAKALYKNSDDYLKQNRLAQARFTLESMKWLELHAVRMWTAVTPQVLQFPKVQALREQSLKDMKSYSDQLVSVLNTKDTKKELEQSYARLKEQTKKLSEKKRKSLEELFAIIDKTDKNSSFREILIERGYAWSEVDL